MARVDRFIKPLFQTGADRLILAVGEKIILASGLQLRPMTTEPASEAQVSGFLKEIVPEDLVTAIADGKSLDFPYASAHGTVLVRVSGGAAAARISIEPITAVEESAAAPSTTGAPEMDTLFRRMVQQHCSDLHITTGSPPLVRKDGDIVALGGGSPLTAERARELLFGITPQRYREQFEERHDADFSYEITGLARFRCNIFLDRMGMGGVFRVIPAVIPSAEELGLSKQILDLCHLNKGLIVVTGPTGSGKSTTLAAMIDYINRTLNAHLITIEDPIEFVHQNRKCLINQREVGTHTLGFKQALRAALREDPDIVLVGEMRDLATVAIAIETAETGHLVFGTLHTNTAPSTVDRIIDQFSPDRQAQVRTMLSESLKGVITQTLCRKKGGGRIAAQEVLIVNSAVSNLIREGKTFQIPSIMQTGKGIGMVCMNDALFDLVRRELVDPEEALNKSVGKTEFKALLTRGGMKAGAA
jgi:twitching motility protein PilT